APREGRAPGLSEGASGSTGPVAVSFGELGGDRETIGTDQRLPPLDGALPGVSPQPADREQSGGTQHASRASSPRPGTTARMRSHPPLTRTAQWRSSSS